MGVFWELGLNAGNESDAGKIKAPEISEYCIMMNGKGEWKEADDTMIDLAEKCVYGILEDKTTIFDIIKDARTCGY